VNRSTLLTILLLSTLACSGGAFSQAVPWFDDLPRSGTEPQVVTQGDGSQLAPQTVAPPVITVTEPSAVTIPAGTRVMMVLRSPLHTTSGTAGSGIYLETLFPVIQGDRVVIPARTQVQGVVESNRRPGHVERVSEFRFRFTNFIFPNNRATAIDGNLLGIPGAHGIRTRDSKGTLQPVDQPEKVVTPAAAGAVGGAIIGSVRHFGIGTFVGAGLGAGLGLGSVLLKRGDEISLQAGTQVEMVLATPLSLDQAQVTANSRCVPPPYAPQAINPAAYSPDAQNSPRRQQRRPASFPGLFLPFGLLR